jgi:hypothetical protein
MLNERTADVAVDARPDEPGTSRTVADLRLIADFLEGFPGLPAPSVMTFPSGTIDVQIPSNVGEPGERCMAVARIAHEAGGIALVKPVSAWWSYETRVTVGDREVHVYAPIEGPDTGRGGDAA